MPKMFTDDEKGSAERFAVVAYLSSLGGAVPEGKTPPIQQYTKSVNEGKKLYLTAGCAACHGDRVTQPPTKKQRDDEEDEKPEAAPEDLAYSFGTAASKGFYLLGHVGSKTSPEALSKYLQNPLATNPHGRMPNMLLNNTEATDIARFLCQQKDDAIAKALPKTPNLKPTELVNDPALGQLKPEQQWREVGKRLMTSKGCVNCHTVEVGGQKLAELATAPKLRELAGSSKACVSGNPTTGQSPSFNLTERDRKSLAIFLREGLSGAGKPTPAYSSRVALRRFQCLNCHNRDGEGGFTPELADQMRLMDKAENADDLAPPRLTAAGHKLRTSWFKQLLTQAGRARPWMTLRMPQYGPHNVEFIAEALPKAEGTLPSDEVGKVALTAAKVEAGRTLAGKNGLGCISCHDISGVRGGGTRGPDLAKTQDRVRLDWYTRWMHQPQRLAPGTKMPQAFIDGKSLFTSVLSGDADAQIEAMWAYFSLGQGLPLPAGMEPPKGLVITVKDRPEILRTFMPDNAGTKAIAVGFPGGLSTVFDAASCRLSYAWSGAFLDASPVWNNRGGAPANLLGPKFWTSPNGFPWAVTDSKTPPDFSKRLTDPAYGFQLPEDRLYNGPRLVQFQGYSLDSAGQPSFKYSFHDAEQTQLLKVVEKPEPLPVTVAAGIKRTFQVEWPANKSTWFQVGSATLPRLVGQTGNPLPLDLKAPEPEASAEGTRLILSDGGKAIVVEVINAPRGTKWRLVPVNGGWQALLKLPEAATTSKGTLSLAIWGLPRDDEELLKGLRSK
jgi:mono/diheme cytochrome c family protein